MGWGKLIYPKKLSGPKLMGWSEKTAPLSDGLVRKKIQPETLSWSMGLNMPNSFL
jgi:hypothetical protein